MFSHKEEVVRRRKYNARDLNKAINRVAGQAQVMLLQINHFVNVW